MAAAPTNCRVLNKKDRNILMKKGKLKAVLLFTILLQTACGAHNWIEPETQSQETESSVAEDIVADTKMETEESDNILIVYFTRLENTDADLDTIIQGGGPYGEIGNSYADADMDAISSASITVRNGKAEGNTMAVAQMIQELTGGDLFSIQTAQSYPVDYDELIDLGGEEKNNRIRPELVTQIENLEDYNIIFLGFPNWWLDMPMAVYSFLEAYDLSGKTVIPFATSAGSGLSDVINTIQELQPEAVVEENGLHIPMRQVAGAKDQVGVWIRELGVTDSE